MSVTWHYEATIENCLKILKDKNVKIAEVEWGYYLSWDDISRSNEIKRHGVKIDSHNMARIINIDKDSLSAEENGQNYLDRYLRENGFEFLWSD